MIRNIIICTLLFLTGCGWTDNDGTEYLIGVAGNIKIEKQRGDNAIKLVLDQATPDDGAQTFLVIAEDCARVYYDSAKANIYVEEYTPDVNGLYTRLSIIDASERTLQKSFKSDRISRKEFESSLKSVKGPFWNFPK